MYVCMYVCMYVYIYIYMHVCMHVCIYIYACMYACIYIYMHVCMCIYIYDYSYMHIITQYHIYEHVCAPTVRFCDQTVYAIQSSGFIRSSRLSSERCESRNRSHPCRSSTLAELEAQLKIRAGIWYDSCFDSYRPIDRLIIIDWLRFT